jgi:hypothetical protein
MPVISFHPAGTPPIISLTEPLNGTRSLRWPSDGGIQLCQPCGQRQRLYSYARIGSIEPDVAFFLALRGTVEVTAAWLRE